MKKEVDPEVFEVAGQLTQESSFEMKGTVRKEPRAPGGFEIGVTGLKAFHLAGEYPISPKEHGVEFLMDHRHLWLRSSRQGRYGHTKSGKRIDQAPGRLG